MRLFRSWIWVAAIFLIAVPALSAFQADQVTGTAAATEKKAKKKVKQAEQTGENAGKSAANATGKDAAANPQKGAAQTPETPKTETPKGAAKGSAQRATPTVSEAEIAAAKASGKVWVNTETGVYHKGGQWYGATKHGKFMTEQEAMKAGYRASKTK